jgi:hypothetical protein
MERVVTSIDVTVYHSTNLLNLSLLCATYAHVHVFVPGVSWNRTTILPYRMLYMLSTLLEMGVRLHVRQQKNHATTLPQPYNNSYPIMTYMTSLYVIYSAPYFMTNTTKLSGDDSFQPMPSPLLSYPCYIYPPTHVPHTPQFTLAALFISSYKRNILTC